MYEEAFHFTSRPFSTLPDPSAFCWTDNHRQAFEAFEQGIRRGCPLILLTGEVGCGKTTLLRHFLDSAPENYNVGLLSSVFRGDLLEWALFAFDQPFANEKFVTLIDRLQSYLVEEFASGRSPILIVDEAQHLTDQDLETLRLLLNINSGADLLLQIALVGQPELRDRLSRHEFRQVVQRIGADFHLRAMNSDETAAYIRTRLVQAGGSGDLFDGPALERIHAITGGVPRKVNLLCELCLVIAFAEDADVIDAELVDSAMSDVRKNAIFRTLSDGDSRRHAQDGEPDNADDQTDTSVTKPTDQEDFRETDAPVLTDALESPGTGQLRSAAEEEVLMTEGTSGDISTAGQDQAASARIATAVGGSDIAGKADAKGEGDARSDGAETSPDTLDQTTADDAENVITLASQTSPVGEAPAADENAAASGMIADAAPDQATTKTTKPRYGLGLAAAAAFAVLIGGVWVSRMDAGPGGSDTPSAPETGLVSEQDDLEEAQTAPAADVDDQRLRPDTRKTAAAKGEKSVGQHHGAGRPETAKASPGEAAPLDASRQNRQAALSVAPKMKVVEDHGPVAPLPARSVDAASAPAAIGAEGSLLMAAVTIDGAAIRADSAPATLRSTGGSRAALDAPRNPDDTDAAIATPRHSGDKTAPSAGPAQINAALAIANEPGKASVRPVLNRTPPMTSQSRAFSAPTPIELPAEGRSKLVFAAAQPSPFPPRALAGGSLAGSRLVIAEQLASVSHPVVPRYGTGLSARDASRLRPGTGLVGAILGEGYVSDEGAPSAVPARLALAAPAPKRTTELPGAPASERVFEMFVREARVQDKSGMSREGATGASTPAPSLPGSKPSGDELFLKALDSGLEDPAAAVVLYARAAISGHQRSAYYLGQIYESGDGVPVDFSLARAWYKAAGPDNRRAQRRLRELPTRQHGDPLSPPVLLSAETVGDGIADFVWTSDDGTDPAFYVVQMAGQPSGRAGVAAVLTVSAARLTVPAAARVWRVVAVDPAGSRYAASDWTALPGLTDEVPQGGLRQPAAALAASAIISAPGTADGQTISQLEAALARLAIPAQVIRTDRPLGLSGTVYYLYDQDRQAAEAISERLSIPATRIDPAPTRTYETELPLPGLIVVTPGIS